METQHGVRRIKRESEHVWRRSALVRSNYAIVRSSENASGNKKKRREPRAFVRNLVGKKRREPRTFMRNLVGKKPIVNARRSRLSAANRNASGRERPNFVSSS
jgi:hypothetical protein